MSLVSWWVANKEEFELAIMNDERSPAENIEKVDALLNTLTDIRASVKQLFQVTTEESRQSTFHKYSTRGYE
ncbi:unnamed protein product [Umbelopsis ramanniana]